MIIENYINKCIYPNSYAQNNLQKVEILFSRQTPDGELSIFGRLFCANHQEVYFMYSQQLIEFGNFLLLKKGLQEITREGHKRSISIIFNKENKEDLSNEELQNHIIWMHSQAYSHSHITNTIKAVEYFTEFKERPLRIAKTRRPKTLIKEVLTEAEIALMIRFCNTLREKAMITLLAYSGIRNKEFCNLKVEDIDFGNSKVLIRNGKFNKDRRINIGASCSNILVEYIMRYGKQKEDFLFTTVVNNNKYNPSDLRKLVKIIAKKVNIQKRVYPHLFRHSLATHLMMRGASIFLIKDQMGHKNIETTVIYILRLPCQIEKEYEKFVPSYL